MWDNVAEMQATLAESVDEGVSDVMETTDDTPGSEAATAAPSAEPPAAGDAPAATPATPATPAESNATGAEAAANGKLSEVAKAKGITDEKIVKLLDLIDNGGNLGNYIKAISEDVDGLEDKEVLRRMVYDKYADLSDEEKEEMYQDEYDSFRQDADLYDEAAINRGKVKLKAATMAYRKEMKQRQMDQAMDAGQRNADNQPTDESIQRYTTSLKTSDAYKGISETGTIRVGDGESAFNMDVDINKSIGYLTDMEAYSQAHLGADGKPDFQKQLLIGAFATDPMSFAKKLMDHGRKMATLGLAAELGNEQAPGANGIAKGGDKDVELALAEKLFG